ncbi:MAG: hypothetical protein IPI54_01695 [Chitinophagaceae bacterium]|nr:hypothetical protein [Chitinophagaceae bacterium]
MIFIKDARILVDFAEGSADSVDVIVLTKDVFFDWREFFIQRDQQGKLRLRDENFRAAAQNCSWAVIMKKNGSRETGLVQNWPGGILAGPL